MPKKIHYLLLLVVLTVPTGCCTIKGAAGGLQQDVQNIANPDKNGWNALKKADAWQREHLW